MIIYNYYYYHYLYIYIYGRGQKERGKGEHEVSGCDIHEAEEHPSTRADKEMH